MKKKKVFIKKDRQTSSHFLLNERIKSVADNNEEIKYKKME